MRGTIMEGGYVAASNVDLLSSTRLQTAPSDGIMLFQVQASDNDATNNYKVDIQLPDSEVPMVSMDVPMGETAGLAGQLASDYMLSYASPIGKGGRVVFGLTETGDAECTWRCTFTPVRR